jgi:peptidoglycan/LPS O-acetylase OafA/YrhL
MLSAHGAPRAKILDAVRGGSAVSVSIAHVSQIWMLPLLGPHHILIIATGSIATWSVATFFALSGLVIAISICRQGNQFDLQRYIIARIWRIAPPLFAGVAVTLISIALIKGFGLYGAESYRLPGDLDAARELVELDWSAVPSTLTLMYGVPWFGAYLSFDGPLWSLSYEFWIYMVAGLACLGILKKAPVAIGAAAASFAMFCFSANPLWFTFSCVWLAGFVVGWSSAVSLRWRRRAYAALVAVGSLLLITMMARHGLGVVLDVYRLTAGRGVYVGVGWIIAGMLGLLIEAEGGRITAIFERVSDFSYTFYLVHFPILLLGLSVLRPYIVAYGLVGHLFGGFASWTMAIMLSALMARFFENKRAIKNFALSLQDRLKRAVVGSELLSGRVGDVVAIGQEVEVDDVTARLERRA